MGIKINYFLYKLNHLKQRWALVVMGTVLRCCGTIVVRFIYRNTKYRSFDNFTAIPHTTSGHLQFFCATFEGISKHFEFPSNLFFNRVGCLHLFLVPCLTLMYFFTKYRSFWKNTDTTLPQVLILQYRNTKYRMKFSLPCPPLISSQLSASKLQSFISPSSGTN